MTFPPRFFFTSDTHFGHQRAAEIRGYRGPDAVSRMNDDLIDAWNSVVGRGDTVYHLGDFALGPKVEWPCIRARLNGTIVLVLGNHDLADQHHNVEPVPHPRLVSAMLPDDRILPHDVVFWTLGIRDLDGGGICFHGAHVPPMADFDDGRGYVRPPSLPGFDIELCGHVHERWATPSNNGRIPRSGSRVVNVGVDVWSAPVTPAQIMAEIHFA